MEDGAEDPEHEPEGDVVLALSSNKIRRLLEQVDVANIEEEVDHEAAIDDFET